MGLFWLGVSTGVTGVVYLPADGYRQTGISGGALGILKGSLGVLAKPIAGLFDFGSKTAEGIKATA
jgi:vacuolar protein sorting-associated protein 13A/C